MPSLKQHVGQVVRNHYKAAICLLAIAAILLAVSYQMVAPALGWTGGFREKLGLYHLLLPLMALGFVLGAVGMFVRAVRLKKRPDRHPVLQRLAAYGDPQEVLSEIDNELAQGDELVTLGRPMKAFRVARAGDGPVLYLTRNWLVQFGEMGVCLARLDDVLWAWKYIVQAPGTLLTTRTYFVRLLVRRGQHEEVLLSESEADRLLLWLLRRAPWIQVGYDPRLDGLWLMKPEQLGELFREIEQQRQTLQRQTPAERETAIQARAQDLTRAETGHREQRS
jgi:hypothetical protein